MRTFITPRKFAAFTLVELLIVIGIILLLSVLIFPVYKSAIKTSQRAGCVANLRQLGTGAALFAGDSGKGEWPFYQALNISSPSGQGTWSSTCVWDNDYKTFVGIGKVYPYLENKKVFFCPTDLANKRRYLDLEHWEDATQNIFGSYVARGFSQTSKPSTSDSTNKIGKKMHDVSHRAITSCFFMRVPNSPTKPISLHDLSWPVLYGDGFVLLVKGLPPNITENANVWGSTPDQRTFWDYFDIQH